MATTPFQGTPRRREVWLRQLIRKWGALSNTGSSGFSHDVDMDHMDHKPNEQNDFYGKEEKFDVDFKDLETMTASSNPRSLVRGQSETLRQQFIDTHQYRIDVHTWNVAGKPPPDDLDLDGWINTSNPADIYVFGFQEVVPLNANNVLCVENDCPAALWEAKIRKTLNKICGQPKSSGLVKCLSVPIPSPSNPIDVIVTDVPEVSDVDRLLAEVASPRFQGNSQSSPTSEESFVHTNKNPTNCKHSVAKLSLERYPSQNGASIAASSSPWNGFSTEHPHQYLRVASKQMVGLFIIVWIRSSLWRQVHNVQVSTVGCGLMNHLGNKGAVSVSMFLHHTSFCFVCSHLTSGHKEGDALRRNADVAEILRRTRFPRLAKLLGLQLPETILAHDRVIWLGDLNYRLALPDKETWTLVKQGDWATLLRVDQLKLEQSEGRVFPDWQEGPIYFPPTYKYMNGSDNYSSGEGSTGSSSKRRSPAWCDRVLWYGQGLHQLNYSREDCKLSDHRSVSATFNVDVEVVSQNKLRRVVKHEVDLPNRVVPRVKPFIDVQKIQENEVWSPLLKTPQCQKFNQEMDDWSDLRGLLDQQVPTTVPDDPTIEKALDDEEVVQSEEPNCGNRTSN
ncbi:type I inositol polyphosphate 5-phosphatase 10 isoform X2 [Physcomitrium patens]|uniref:Inositol polyphosphate-related phosphatase domain-containing protein n=1 Tax=Physcomitrium patens TaxID=3218 RepID=A0A2K1LAP5_PHYPA|nr:type IV inositol polyphosphate 5-phosphatase 9-like isoform X2 [Physcomitrium patens]PNR63097.1 hypothetical protein PHYPA_001522 [Physcomitrium patens]|eukprot:XP_024373685.1 type IV inositol polyphosphate 5-phosphatase 9-like isoform X2 [Physcomitrella patens]